MRGHLLHFRQQMAGEEHGDSPAPRQLADQSADFVNARRVQSVGGFIEQQQVRISEQRLRQAEPLLHSGRISAHSPVCRGGQAHCFQSLPYGAKRSIQKPPVHLQVFPPREVQVKRRGFHQRADFRERPETAGFERLSEEKDAAAVRPLQTEDHPDRGGFTRAVRAQKPIDGPLRHGEAEALYCRRSAVGFPDVFNLHGRRHGG